jgi:hypothetical protein
MVKKIKELLKKNPEPARGTVGVNPSDTWSAKANISEAGSLDTYLKSRGINPRFISKDTKISHSKTNEFQKWKNDRKFESVEYLDEDAMLAKYLMSRGINPRYVTKNQLIAHSKSGEFTKWKHDHMVESTVTEETDKKDMICMDIPLLIRVLEFTREEMSSDIELHNMVERLINMRHDVPLDMTHYDEITSKLVKEEVLDESPKEGGKRKFSGMYNPAPKGTFAYDQAMRKKKHDEIEKNQSKDGSGMTSAIDRLQAHMNKEETELDEASKDNPRHPMHQSDPSLYKKTPKSMTKQYATHAGKFFSNKDTVDYTLDYKKTDKEAPRYRNEEVEQIDELKKSTLSSYKDKSSASLKNAQANRDAAEPGKDMSKGFADLHAKSNKIAKNRVKGLIGYMQRKQGMKPTSENTLDSMAATEAPSDCSDNTNSTPTTGKSYASKMIKGLKKTVKEETYDWEKDDKNQTSPGKKNPKLFKADPKASAGEGKPEARAVMSGGTTLTGEPRDTVEIDPLMKNRPDLNGNVKDDAGNKKNNKINN